MRVWTLKQGIHPVAAFAQNSAGDYSAGTTALGTVTEEIAKYVPYVVKLWFGVVVNLILLPFMMKSKKSMMRTTRLQPRIA